MPIKRLKREYHTDPFKNSFLTCYNYKNQHLPIDEITIAAFDPGVVNTGFRVEKRYKDSDGNDRIESVLQKLIISDSKSNSTHFYINMKNEIYNVKEELKKCDYILVESQMHNNPQATRMCQHIISTLLTVVDDSKTLVIEILPTVKSRSFGIKGIKGKELKKWAVEKATKMLEERNDEIGSELVKKSKKKDDQCDVILYCDSWARFLKCKEFKDTE